MDGNRALDIDCGKADAMTCPVARVAAYLPLIMFAVIVGIAGIAGVVIVLGGGV